jgi:hypothetical protein
MRGAAGSGSCDSLTGPDKERCLHQGGSASVSAKTPPRR